MSWNEIDSSLVWFFDGVDFYQPVYEHESKLAIIYHCEEGGFSVMVDDGSGEYDDGEWAETLENAKKQANFLLNK